MTEDSGHARIRGRKALPDVPPAVPAGFVPYVYRGTGYDTFQMGVLPSDRDRFCPSCRYRRDSPAHAFLCQEAREA